MEFLPLVEGFEDKFSLFFISVSKFRNKKETHNFFAAATSPTTTHLALQQLDSIDDNGITVVLFGKKELILLDLFFVCCLAQRQKFY